MTDSSCNSHHHRKRKSESSFDSPINSYYISLNDDDQNRMVSKTLRNNNNENLSINNENCSNPLKRASSSMFSIATLPAINSADSLNSGENGGACSDFACNEDFFIEETDISEITPIIEEKEEATKAVRESVNHLNRTGIVFLSSELHFDLKNKFHKERPQRVKAIRDYLSKTPLSEFQRSHDGRDNSTFKLSTETETRITSDESLLKCCIVLADDMGSDFDMEEEMSFLRDEHFVNVHLPGYIERMDAITSSNTTNTTNKNLDERIEIEASQYKSIYLTRHSFDLAKTAACLLCKIVSKVMVGELDNGFAVVRPPGHHAEPGTAGGYSVINNVAIAASFAIENLGASKILVVDWDIHHGNGLQKIFYDDPNVLYFSVHRYHGGRYFPFLPNAGPEATGFDDGAGFNINVGWNQKGLGDTEYKTLWDVLLMPIGREFNPDLVLVSAGFDAGKGDMGEMDVSPECFAYLTQCLMTLANGRVVCSLEGGYLRSILSRSVGAVIASLLQKDKQSLSEEAIGSSEDCNSVDLRERFLQIERSAYESILATVTAHRKYWTCLQTMNFT